MDSETLSNTAAKHANQRNIAAGIALISLVSTLLLAFKVVFQDIEVRMVPGLGGDAMAISRSKVGHNYLQQVTRDLVTSWANSTSNSEKYVRDVMTGYVCPAYEGAISQEISDRWDEIKRKKLTTVFYPTNFKTHPEKLVASARGRLESWVGKLRTSSEEIEFRIDYQLVAGRICFSKFVGIER